MGIPYYILIILQITSYSSFEAYPLDNSYTLVFEILHDRNDLEQNSIIKALWEREPSSFCNIVKPTKENLVDKNFVEFNFVSILCMILYDVSLRYMQLHLPQAEINFTQVINTASPNTFCQEMKNNTWVTSIDENKPWVSHFDQIMKKEHLCTRYCVAETVNPLCALVLKFDLLEKKAEHKLTEKHRNNFGNLKVPLVTESKPAPSPATMNANTSSERKVTPSKLLDIKTQNYDKLVAGPNNDRTRNSSNTEPKNGDHIPNSSNTEPLVSAPNTREHEISSRPHSGDPIAKDKNESAGHLPMENSIGSTEKNISKQKTTVKTSSTKPVFISGSDIQQTSEIAKTEACQDEPQSPNCATSLKPVSKVSEEDPDKKLGEVKFPKVIQGPSISDSNDKVVGGSTQPNIQQTGSQKTIENSSPAVIPKSAVPESVPKPEHQENNHPESVNTTDAVVKEKAKPEVSKDHPTEVSKLPQLFDQIGRSEIEEADNANEPEFDGESPSEPDDHEDQKKMDDGVMGSQLEDGSHVGSLGGVNPPQDSEDDLVDQQDPATEEPRFENEEPAPKPDPSTKVAADYAGASDEDDEAMWRQEGRVTQNDADAGFSHDRFIDAEDSHFFAYFMTMIILCILGYLIFHNKQKILALALEGRVRKGSRRRPSTSGYRKLDSNLEEAVTSNCTGSSVTHVIY